MALPEDPLDPEREALRQALTEIQAHPAIPAEAESSLSQTPSMVPSDIPTRTQGPLTQSPDSLSYDDRVGMLLDRSGDIEQTQPQTPYEVPTVVERPYQSGEMPFDFRRALLSFAGGDVGAYDQRRAAWDNRDFTRQDQELDLETKRLGITGKRGEFEDKQAQRLQARTLLDPNSPQSRQSQQMFKDKWSTLARTKGVQGQPIAETIMSAINGADTRNASQLASLDQSFEKLLGNTFKAVHETNQGEISAQNADFRRRGVEAQEKLANNTIANTRDDNLLQRERFEWDKGKSVGDKLNVRLSGDQRKLVGEMATNLNQVRIIQSIVPLAEKYASDTGANIPGMGKSGVLSGPVQTLKSMANQTSNKEYNKFRSDVQRLFSVERKTFAGVAVSPQEMEVLAPMIPDFNKDSEQTIRDKLTSALQYLQTTNDTKMSQLEYDTAGNPIDRSLLTKMLAAQAPTSTQNNPAIRQAADGVGASPQQAKRPKAPAGAKVGKVYPDKKSGKRYKVLEDMTLEEVP